MKENLSNKNTFQTSKLSKKTKIQMDKCYGYNITFYVNT